MWSPVEPGLIHCGFEWKAMASGDALAWFVGRRHGHAGGGDCVERFGIELDACKS
jgi:hypothetical protein